MAAAAAAVLLASHAVADSVQKLGFIDTERVYQQSVQAQRIQTTLQNEFGARQQALQRLRDQGIALKARLDQGRLSPTERRRIEQQLIALDGDLRRQTAQLTEEYNLRRNEEFAALQQNANRVITELAQRDGYDLIIQDVIYVNSKFDITDQVIRALNSQ
ncbi:OmpH family outer membrane protein [Eikenella halliae]|uniref:OmpH family outer membrane protein n=1 Tax=Eikenella halliae TaxID=1795832 RepID=UPI00370DDDA8